MAKYLIKASYTPEGVKGVMDKGGTSRQEAIETMVTSVGGTVEACYFAFGDDDIFIIVDAPSNEAVAAVAGAVGGTGAVSRYSTIVLLTAEQLDEAAEMDIDYTPPGKTAKKAKKTAAKDE